MISRDRALRSYHDDPDRSIYRVRLRMISRRKRTRADQIFAGVRRRIALADFIRRTPDLTWNERAALSGAHPVSLAETWRRQLAGECLDADACDRIREERGHEWNKPVRGDRRRRREPGVD